MIYNDFQGLKLSALGMGNMRLPVLDGNDNNIDADAAKEMIAFCMKSGIQPVPHWMISAAVPL